MRPERAWRVERTDLLRYAIKLALVGAAYYVSARLGLRLSLVQKNVTPLWPPTGIAVAAFLVFGRGLWPGVALAAFFVNLPISTNALAAAATAAGNTLAPLCAAYLLDRVGFRREIDRTRDAIAIVFLGALFAMAISASIGTGTLVLSDAIPAQKFMSTWAVWWTGDATGVLVVAPFLLSVRLLLRERDVTLPEAAEAGGLLVVLFFVSFGVVHSDLHLLFLVFPIVGWAAWRFQQRWTPAAALLVAATASWAASRGLGPFAHGTLFQKMLTLQGFNATVAFSSLFFAALVTERVRARAALERSAADLEDRVQQRTSELSVANTQLGEAQRLASLGSWDWDIATDRVTWSDELYRIYGLAPREFAATYRGFLERVHPGDRTMVDQTVQRSCSDGSPFSFEHRIVRPDGTERVLQARGEVLTDQSGRAVRMAGTGQDVTETKKAEREHRIAETLQRSLLPDRLPEIPGVLLAARYVPASADMEVGGDWYDVVQLPNGHVGMAIGDVAGHGLRAASTMGQLRMALRAYALEEAAPAAVLSRVHHLVRESLLPDIVTLLYLVFDPDTGTFRFANAGHPPPLVLSNGGGAYLEMASAPPLGAVAYPGEYPETSSDLAPESTLLLFTDGLVERRGASIQDGLNELRTEAARSGPNLEDLCDRLLHSMVGKEVADDIALLALRPVRLERDLLRLRVPAEPHALAPLRRTLRRWLREVGAGPRDANDVLLASGEAATNVIQHAYGASEGSLEMELSLREGVVEVSVRDRGSWRPRSGSEGGRGLELMKAFMDSVEVSEESEGTVVRMRRRIETGGGGDRTGPG